MSKSSVEFKKKSSAFLEDPQARATFRNATDNMVLGRQVSLKGKEDMWESLRDVGHEIRSRAMGKLPDLLVQLEETCTANGVKVHWAERTDEARGIVHQIMKSHGATRCVKSKSMLSEEIGLTPFLEERGIEAVETDLGEYIIQLAGEMPSHIVAPAIHKNRKDIAALLNEKLKIEKYSEDAQELTSIARNVLRKKFQTAQVGISGVNFAVAETGTICLVENEGNIRYCTTVPPVHIAIMGIEKVVEKLDDIPPLLDILARSCTGQRISTYFSMLTGPRRKGEKDGPTDMHLIIVDNNRSRIFQDEQLRKSLMCIRCSACLNHCPVYSRVGGHAYSSVYPGPIGIIISPLLRGMEETGALPGASSLCGICSEVCPVRIPLTEIILRIRKEGVTREMESPVKGAGVNRTFVESIGWRFWSSVTSSLGLYRLGGRLIRILAAILPIGVPPPANRWTKGRTLPKFASKSLHDLVEEGDVPSE